jgi:hypothetical protein
LTSNPFPDAEELVVRDDDAADVQARFRTGRNGVSKVIYERKLTGVAG